MSDIDVDPGYSKLRLIIKCHGGEITRIETFSTSPIESEVSSMLRLMRSKEGLADGFTMEISNVLPPRR